MHTAACPKCNDQVTLPDGTAEEAIVRCPLCQAEYSLSEALEKLPPRLIVVSMPAPQYSPALELPRTVPAAALAAAPLLGAAHEPLDLHDAQDLQEMSDAREAFEMHEEAAPAADMADAAIADSLALDPVDQVSDEWQAAPPAEMPDDALADSLSLEPAEQAAAEWQTAPPTEAGDDMFGAAGEMAPDAYEEIPLADAEQVAPTPEGYSFEEGEAPSALAAAVPGGARPPKPPKKGGGILQLAGVMLGGLMAIPLAQLVLWYLPGGFSRDFGLGPKVAAIGFLKPIVPEEFRGEAHAKAPVTAPPAKPAQLANTRPPAHQEAPQPTAETGDLLSQALGDKKLPIDGAAANESAAANGNNNSEKPGAKPELALEEMPEDKGAGDLAVTPPPAVPDADLTFEPKVPVTPDKIGDPFGETGKVEPKAEPKPDPLAEPQAEPKTEPAAKPDPFDALNTEPKPEPKPEPATKPDPVDAPNPEPKPEPKPEPTSEPKPEPKPEAEPKPAPVPVVAALTGDAATVLKEAPAAKADDLAKSLTAVAELEKLWDALAADAPKEEKGKIAREMREALATLGQTATFLEAEAAKDPAQGEGLHHQLEHLGSDATKLQVVATGAAGWLASPSRTTNGVILAGAVKEVKQVGDVYETHLELLTAKGGTMVVVLGKQDPTAALPAGTRVVVAGVIIDEPATNVTGYSGEAKQAVWAGQVVPLAAKEQRRRELLMSVPLTSPDVSLWDRYVMALDDVSQRLERITRALREARVPYALVGGQAVALWVATRDPAAVRTTKDVDLLIQRSDLPAARAAARAANFDYFEVMDVGMFLEQTDPNPRRGVHLVWAGEKVRADYTLPSPAIEDRITLGPNLDVVSLAGLVRMKLMANRDQDRVHLRDMIDVGLIGRDLLSQLPAELAARLEALLAEQGR